MNILFALYKHIPFITAILSMVAIYAEKIIKYAAILCSKSGGGDLYAMMCCVARDRWEKGLHAIVGSLLFLGLKKKVSFFRKLNDSNTNDKIMVKISLTLWP